MASKKEKRRLQFDFTPEAVDALDELKGEMGAASRAEVIRRALRLLTKVNNTLNGGGNVILTKGDGTQSALHLY